MLSETSNCYLCNSATPSKIIVQWIDNETNEDYNIVECICGFNYLNPRPTEQTLSRYYSSEIYHPHSRGRGLIYYFFDLSRKFTFWWKLRIIRKLFKGSFNLLDYGSGDGAFVSYLRKKGINAFGYDEYFIKDSPGKLKENSYNIITLWHSLEHVHNLDKLFSTLDNFLESKGKIIFSVPNMNAPERKYFSDNWKAYDIPRHLYHFDSLSLERLLKIKGYKIIKKKRMFLDTIYISILSKHDELSHIRLFYIIFVSLIKVIVKGPNFSSSLLYVCEKTN